NRPVQDGGWVVTHEDITERSMAKRELERTRNFLQAVIENVPVTIAVKDARTLTYMLINRTAELFYRVPRERMIGKAAKEVFSQKTAAVISAHDRDLLEKRGKQDYGEHPVEVPGGGVRIARTTRLPVLDENGVPRYLLSVLEDVTERKRAEARIE